MTDEEESVYVAYLDIQEVFDEVPDVQLLKKKDESTRIRGKTLACIIGWLDDRRPIVAIN